MHLVKILRYRAIKCKIIVNNTASTDLIEQLIKKSRKKVEDGAEGYMASLSVKAYMDFNFHINSHSPDSFIKCLVKIGFLEVVE